jgi:hypothetical protein
MPEYVPPRKVSQSGQHDILSFCQASMWLLGSSSQCSKPAGHGRDEPRGHPDRHHRIVIEWTTEGQDGPD